MDAEQDNPGRASRQTIRPANDRAGRPLAQYHHRRISQTSAFTLIEILIAVGIIAVLVTMFIAGGPRMISSAHSAACASNLRGIQHAMISYSADHNNCLPPGYTGGVAWVEPVWPYLSQGEYAQQAGKRRGVTYCPSTTTIGQGIYKRDRATWRTDYEVNPNVLSSTASANNLATLPGRLVLSFDSGGGASGGSAVAGDSRASRRHNDCFNAVFVDGHVELLATFTTGHTNDWKKP